MDLNHIAQLRPEPAQIRFQQFHGMLDLWFDRPAQSRFDFHLKIALPMAALPDDPPCSPKRESFPEQFCSFGRRFATSLFHPAQETSDLAQCLFLARIKKKIDARKPRFVPQNCLE